MKEIIVVNFSMATQTHGVDIIVETTVGLLLCITGMKVTP